MAIIWGNNGNNINISVSWAISKYHHRNNGGMAGSQPWQQQPGRNNQA